MGGPRSGDSRSVEPLEHFGVKGMHWGVRQAKRRLAPAIKTHGPAAVKGLKKNVTAKTFGKAVAKSGGLHKISDEQLKKMNERMEMERKFSTMMNADKERRAKGFQAIGKILGEAGKIALPIIIGGFVANRAASSPVFRTTATVVGKRALDAGRKVLGQ